MVLSLSSLSFPLLLPDRSSVRQKTETTGEGSAAVPMSPSDEGGQSCQPTASTGCMGTTSRSASDTTTIGYRGDTKVLYQRSVCVRRPLAPAELDQRKDLLGAYAGKVIVLYYEPAARQAATNEFDLRAEHQRFNLNRHAAGLPPLRREEFEAWHKASPGSWFRPPEPRAVTQNQMHANDWKRIQMQLDAQKVDYVGINGADGSNDILRGMLWDIAGRKTFPLVFIDNACLGGAEAIKDLVLRGNFQHAFSAHVPLPAPRVKDAPKTYIREKGADVALGGYHTIDY
eukprot:scaffold175320_cov37-Tisochrysis_lutea.AAC.1